MEQCIKYSLPTILCLLEGFIWLNFDYKIYLRLHSIYVSLAALRKKYSHKAYYANTSNGTEAI